MFMYLETCFLSLANGSSQWSKTDMNKISLCIFLLGIISTIVSNMWVKGFLNVGVFREFKYFFEAAV